MPARTRALLSSVLLAAIVPHLAATAAAQPPQEPAVATQGPPQRPKSEAELRYDEWQAARVQVAKESTPLLQRMQAKDTPTDEKQALQRQVQALNNSTEGLKVAFHRAFAHADWNALHTKDNDELLRLGLSVALVNMEEPQVAVRACQTFLEFYGNEQQANGVRAILLPQALIATRQIDEAERALTAALATRPNQRSQILLGDIYAATGRLDEAAAQYTAAGENAQAKTRRQLLGKPAPELASDLWFGDMAQRLSAMRGHTVLLDFFGTWCGPWRMQLPMLSELQRKHADAGLLVVGVTRAFPNGYLPRKPEELVNDGQILSDVSAASLPDHLTRFRSVIDVSYPFAIATEDDFKRFGVTGVPTRMVLDRAGIVTLVLIGGGNEALLQVAVERLVKPAK